MLALHPCTCLFFNTGFGTCTRPSHRCSFRAFGCRLASCAMLWAWNGGRKRKTSYCSKWFVSIRCGQLKKTHCLVYWLILVSHDLASMWTSATCCLYADGPRGEERAHQAEDAGDVGEAAASSDSPRHGLLRLLRQAQPEEVRPLDTFLWCWRRAL